ncbi:ABC transporter permease [Mycoplasmopsis cynos]|uniref:ABC transporter permease n=1 Tax=Mycoplasmopsis cynos TaxID=171284 RepID=UPI0021FBB9A0|nr:ABC transporter permease subunit [Mycoplasmopsis cynos]UWV92466.1 ABC transporter permease subunit [Mycoplasmopsis cynos]
MSFKIKSLFKFDGKASLFIPYFLLAIFLIILPIIMIIVSAFSTKDFDAYVLVKDANTWNIIFRSLWIGIVSALLCLLIGFPYAYFVSISKSKIFKIFALSLIISPLAIFTVARIYSIKGLALFVFASNPKSLNNELFIIFGLTYLNVPLMIIFYILYLKISPKNIIEASHDLGFNNVQTIFKVIIPYGTRAIISGLGIIFLSSATTFIVSAKLLPDGSQNQLIGTVINSKINPGNKYDLSTGSMLVIVVSAIFIGIYSLLLIVPKIIFKLKKGAYYE